MRNSILIGLLFVVCLSLGCATVERLGCELHDRLEICEEVKDEGSI